MRQRAGPHDGCTMGVVVWMLEYHGRGSLHRAQQGLGNGIGEQGILVLREVAFHSVHHDVGGTGGRLVRRQRVSALGVHDGKATAAEVAVHATLQHALVVGDDTTRRHLRSCGRDGEDHADGQTLTGNGTTVPEIPHVAGISHSIADSLRRVDDRAAANGQNEVHMLAATEFDTLPDLREQGIGHYPTQLHKRNAGLGEHRLYLIQQS